MISEQKLIKEVKRGKPKYQKLLFEIYAPKMLGVCSRYFQTMEEAEDALQDGFVKVFSNINSFRGNGSFEGWIRRIMVNTSLNLHRKNLKHYYHIDIADTETRISDIRLNFDQLEVQDLLNMIQELPNGYRLVFNLYEIEGYSHKEIADELGVSVNTSKSQLLKARRRLREKSDKQL
jgi:RNA polymerase sigma-70 factor (ECF subfamily)